MTTAEKPGCLSWSLQLLGLTPKSVQPRMVQDEAFPYHLRDDFLSPAELGFYHVLRNTVADWAMVCPKVSLKDLFFAQTGDYGQNRSWMNRIDRKHVDFLLCDPRTMRPLMGVELDDASHERPSRQERDRFVEQVFAVAGLPLVQIPVRNSYDTRKLATCLGSKAGVTEPAIIASTTPGAEKADPVIVHSPVATLSSEPPPCPKCGAPMTVRVVTKEGSHKGKQFWGCPNFPKCRGVREIKGQI